MPTWICFSYHPDSSGLIQIGSQPSAISPARARFFGPSAPMYTGIGVGWGCVIDLSGLPLPVAPGASAG